MSKKSLGVFIGRFQPFHMGHLHIIKEALKEVEHLLILVGSSGESVSLRNPFDSVQRGIMIEAVLEDENIKDRVSVDFLYDQLYDTNSWVSQVMSKASSCYSLKVNRGWEDKQSISLVGYEKDHSSFYLKLFPFWSNIAVTEPWLCKGKIVNSTDIREAFIGVDDISTYSECIPKSVVDYMVAFRQSKTYGYLLEEHKINKEYKQSWSRAPYPPTFVTVDAVVVQAGHILMVERKASPGKGLYALPGGFVNQGETLETGMIRELREETKLKVPVPVIKGSITNQRVYDDPHRSTRGRTITHAFLVELDNKKEGLPKVKGNDDAKEAFWMPLADLDIQRSMVFEDHYHIIKNIVE